MAENNNNIETGSRLLENSGDFRTCSLAKNSPTTAKDIWSGYVCGNEYVAGTPDTISDGDNRGRDPKDGSADSQCIGTNIDINKRTELLTKNAKLYTRGNEYCAGSDRV